MFLYRLILLFLPLTMLAVGCHSVDVPAESFEVSAVYDTPATMPPPWSDEGLDVQPGMTWLQQRTPLDMGYSPGTTGWRDADITFRAEFTDPDSADYTTPGVLLHGFIGVIGSPVMLGQDVWEYTARIMMNETDRATGVLLVWGLQDDAMAGHDLKVGMQRHGDYWHIVKLEERYHCRRGVTDHGLCL
jgi:hypothetical protein